MKFSQSLFLLVLVFASIFVANTDDRVQIQMYTESLCPDCIQFITTSLKDALNTPDFDQIANLSIYPYGNANETQSGSEWVFSCQHGSNECYGNLMEACLLNKLPSNITLPFIECLEETVQDNEDFDSSASTCATQFNVNLDETYLCMNSTEGNQLQHSIAVDTNQLSPKHQYVPWIVINGNHDTTAENDVINDMVSYVCENYQGTIKIAACSSTKNYKTYHNKGRCWANTGINQVQNFLRKFY